MKEKSNLISELLCGWETAALAFFVSQNRGFFVLAHFNFVLYNYSNKMKREVIVV